MAAFGELRISMFHFLGLNNDFDKILKQTITQKYLECPVCLIDSFSLIHTFDVPYALLIHFHF